MVRSARKAPAKRRLPGRARRAARRAFEDESAGRPSGPGADHEPLGPMFAAGPALSLADASREAERRRPGAAVADEQEAETARAGATAEPAEREAEAETQRAPVASVRGASQKQAEAAHAGSLRLQGRTDATFESSFRTTGVRVQPATGSAGCTADCVRATGVLVATYRARTRVTLPSVRDFPELTPCQRRRVQAAITNVLAPHEQQHVAAFRTYDGTTRTPFDLTLRRDELDAAIRAMFVAEDQARQSAAQAASDALDPFHFDVDLNCEDRPGRRATSGPTVAGEPPGPGEEDEP